MDTASLFLGVSLLLIFVAPVGFLIMNQSITERKNIRALNALAAQNNLRLTITDHLPRFSIGLDPVAQNLLVLPRDKEANPKVIDLKKVKSTVIVQKTASGSAPATADDIVQIFLIFNSGNTASEILFFDQQFHLVTERETRLQLAEKWEKIVSTQLGK